MLPGGPWLRTSWQFGLLVPGKEWTVMDLYWKPTGSITSSFDTGLAASDFLSTYGGDLLPLLGTNIRSKGAHVVVNDGVQTWGGSAIDGSDGSGPGDSLPETECFVVATHGTAAGRHGNSHLRFSGLDESFQDGNDLSSAAVPLISTLCADIVSGFTSFGVDFHPQILNKATGVLTTITTATPVTQLGSNRRRKPRF